MYGYAIRATRTGMVKIGIATNVKTRLYSYRTHCAEPVELAYHAKFSTEREARDWERKVLEHFWLSKSHGEWLLPNPELTASVDGGLLAGVVSVEARRKTMGIYRQLLKADGRALVAKVNGEWTVSFTGAQGEPLLVPVSSWDVAIKFAKWYCRHGVQLRDDVHSAFELLIEGAIEDILDGHDPAEMPDWPDFPKVMVASA